MPLPKNQSCLRRQIRTRSKIKGTAVRPRLSVFRSNRYLSAQLIDDTVGTTLAAISRRAAKGEAAKIGEELAKLAKEKKIETVVFDRGGYRFIGKVKQLADGARKGGLKF